jgi:hypothetical protein
MIHVIEALKQPIIRVYIFVAVVGCTLSLMVKVYGGVRGEKM